MLSHPRTVHVATLPLHDVTYATLYKLVCDVCMSVELPAAIYDLLAMDLQRMSILLFTKISFK